MAHYQLFNTTASPGKNNNISRYKQEAPVNGDMILNMSCSTMVEISNASLNEVCLCSQFLKSTWSDTKRSNDRFLFLIRKTR